MLVFAASDKGGTGRSVTSANLAYHHALDGSDVCFLDFDFGSPTAATVFDLPDVPAEAEGTGLHAYLRGAANEPLRIDVWSRTEHLDLRDRPAGSGRLVLVPGDRSGGEFVTGEEHLHRCVDLILRLHREFDVIVVDLSAGRSYAVDLVLAATSPRGGLAGLKHRWLVFHRWTRQHVAAAAELAFGPRGIVQAGAAMGHEPDVLRAAIRFVRAAVPDLESPPWSHVTPAQYAWMRHCDSTLETLASTRGVGRTWTLASIPLEPVLQWQERLITIEDVYDRQIANQATWDALIGLAQQLTDDTLWGER
ncbi:SCO2523 family variant P-loop protein [Streptomyces marokkonensis]|uniref:SCO2523 family variant P-loop protein n=1 Tax=Streptomyces marokkonensis TaxID=324855 RepID=UPI0011F17391|nr:SCO2523 family variant P-loop protein [Streptomyces marokkonensis]